MNDPQPDADLQAEPGHAVLVVHGYLAPRLITTLLARRLAAMGYRTANLAYPSVLPSIEQVSGAVARQVRELADDSNITHVHLVAHSMGGLLVRCALSDPGLGRHVGRIVMMATPNGGSKVATCLSPMLGWFSRPLREMSHRPGSFVNCLPPTLAGLEVGVIAASRDIQVHAASTHLTGEADHITVSGSHTSIVFSRHATRQAAHFLKHGRFWR